MAMMSYNTVLTDNGTEAMLLASIFETHGANLLELSESVRLKSKDFCDSRHQMIYSSMLALYRDGKPIDAVNVRGYLRDHKANNAKLLHYVARLAVTPSGSVDGSWDAWGKSLKDKANRRRTLGYLEQVQMRVADLGVDLDTTLDGLSANARTAASVIGDVKPRLMSDIIQHWQETRGKLVSGVKSGIWKLDNFIRVFGGGTLTILAARPRIGKTATSLQFWLNALAAGKHCLYFSLEMTEEQIMRRVAANVSRTDSNAYRPTEGDISDTVKDRTDKALAAAPYLSNGTIITAEQAPIGVLEVSRYVRYFRRLWGSLDAVYIDYLGKMRESSAAKRTGANVNYALGSITSDLHNLAQRENIAIILASQLSRKCEERNDKRPILSDLRDSGELEQDADCVIGLYRDAVYNESAPPDVMEISILKNREGPQGTIMTRYTLAESRIEELDSDAMEAYKAATREAEAQKQETARKKDAKEAAKGANMFGDVPPPDDVDISSETSLDDPEIPF